MTVTYVLEIDLAAADVAAFDAYERAALPLLSAHGGALVQRLRDPVAAREWHVLRVPDEAAWEAFRDDPRRLALADRLAAARVVVARHRVDVLDWRGSPAAEPGAPG